MRERSCERERERERARERCRIRARASERACDRERKIDIYELRPELNEIFKGSVVTAVTLRVLVCGVTG